MQAGLAKLGRLWTLSGAQPGNTAGQPSYTVRIAPKDDGGLLGAAELAWDAARGVPLRAAVFAQGTQKPVLELEATDIDYGPIAASKVDATPPPGAKVTEIDPPTGVDAHGSSDPRRGRRGRPEAARLRALGPRGARRPAAAQRAAGQVRRQDGRAQHLRRGPRRDRRLPAPRGAWRRQAGLGGLTLPQVNIDGATGTELATALGTLVTFERGGVNYLVAGSVPPVAAENAARGLK